MLGQNLVEHFSIVMEGKSDVFYESVRFFLLNPVEAVEFFVDFIVIHAHVVQQIIIKIRNTCFSHLLVENRIAVFFCFQKSCMQLVCQGETVSRVTIDECVFCCVFTLEIAVHPRGVEIRKTFLQKCIHHFFRFFQIDAAAVVRVGQRKAHQTETEFLLACKYFCHFICPPFVF